MVGQSWHAIYNKGDRLVKKVVFLELLVVVCIVVWVPELGVWSWTI